MVFSSGSLVVDKQVFDCRCLEVRGVEQAAVGQ